MQPLFLKRSNSTLIWFHFSGLIFVQIRNIGQLVALLQDVYRNSVKHLSPMDITTYIEILESSQFLGSMNSTNSDKDTLSNSTLAVSMLNFNSILLSFNIPLTSMINEIFQHF